MTRTATRRKHPRRSVGRPEVDVLGEAVRAQIDEFVCAVLDAVILGREYHRDKGGRFAPGGSPAQLHDEATIHATFNYTDEATGMSAKVTGIRRGANGSSYVDVEITDRAGHTVGGATRTVRPAEQAEVRHDGIHLDGAVRGQGFATRWNAQAEESYRAHGIKRVTLFANEDVGGYAWARAGYDFGTADARAGVARRARAAADKYGFDDALRAQVERLANDPKATPLEYSVLGYTPGAKVWPGKRIMYASQWEGVKQL